MRRRLASLLFLTACTDPTSAIDGRTAPAVTPVAMDSTGVPRLLHAKLAAPAATTTPLAAGEAMTSAKRHLAALAPTYRVPPGAMPELRGAGEVAVRGGVIARVQQLIDGIPIENGELRLLVKPGGELATASGTLVGTHVPRTAKAFTGEVGDEAGAIARAMRHVHGAAFDRTALARKRGELHAGTAGDVTVQLARAQQVWHKQGSRLVAAWVVEAYSSRAGTTTGDATRTVIDGSGHILAHRSLVADAAFQYRVFADNTGEKHPFDGPTADATPHPAGAPNGFFPPYVAPVLVTVDGLNNAGGTPDSWLAAGATETSGNNCDAYADFNEPDGLTAGDFRATATAAGKFDRTYNTAAEPLSSQAQQMAAITSLFYNINWLHDFWYDRGFNEQAGNGQASNFGRGGVEGDAVLAEAQDNANGGSRNNANMSTPSDGMPPRMQVFLWSGADERSMTVANRTPAVNTAAFGPASFDVTGQIIVAADGAGASPTDACEALTNTVTNKIVVVDRGNCSFKSKALRVQQAGGKGMILADNVANTSPPSMGGDNTITATITIGSLSVTQAEGATIKTNVGANATLHRLAGVELDGGLDSTLIAHEFGHYLHHRLQSCGTKMCGAISEGWGDFLAMMITLREGDNLDGAFPFSVYTTQSFGDDAAYFGIRRAPYSADPTINSLSFRHMGEGAELPTDTPFKQFGNNSEVHNAGEIWAAMMFEGYIALQKAGTSFTEARDKMAEYVVAGLLLAPTDGTPTETRDAILAAAFAANPADHDVLIAAFARRGMGSCAESPPRESTDFTGIVESAEVTGRALPGDPVIMEGESCDSDGILDAGETARIKVPITNPGHGEVGDVNVTVTSATPGVTVVGGAAAIGTMAPYTATEVEVEVQLDPSAREALNGELAFNVAATGACSPTVTNTVKVRMNADELPESSATDSMDALATLWSPQTDSEPGWSQKFETGLDGFWHGADLGVLADTALESPVLAGEAGKPVVVTFTHRYSFEFSDGTAFDGGVIEVSTDGGTTWTDVKDLGIDPGYSADVITTDSNNPIGGRNGFTAQSPGYPSTTEVSLDFGTQLAGKNFQIRFRIGTDQAAGAEGWEIDDVAFSGIVGTPFATVVADAGACSDHPPGSEDGGCCDAGPFRASNGLFALGIAALVLRRRRRR